MNVAPTVGRVLTGAQQTEYLEALADPDVTPDAAAKLVGMTGTKMRHLRKRDAAWNQRCLEVEDDRKIARAVAVVEEAHERGKISDRIFEVLLATYGPMVEPAFGHLRRDRMRVEQHTTGLVIHLDPGAIDALPLAEKKKLRDALARAGGQITGGPVQIEQGG